MKLQFFQLVKLNLWLNVSHLFSNFDSYTSSSFEKFIFGVFVYISV